VGEHKVGSSTRRCRNGSRTAHPDGCAMPALRHDHAVGRLRRSANVVHLRAAPVTEISD